MAQTASAPPVTTPGGAAPQDLVGGDSGERPSSAVRAFTALFIGYPVWWLLGIASVLPLLIAGVLALDLSRRPRVVVPRGWIVWLLFLGWVALGALVLGSDAPGAVPGGLGGSRLLVFVYRGAWYLGCTVVMLWVYGTSSRSLSFRRVSSCFAALYVVTTIGGVAGVVFATVDFPSVVEAALPGSLAHNGFVQELVHPGLADVEQVLGHDEARPKAPFPFTNTWGSCVALLLPFFIQSWWRHGSRRQRWAAPIVLLTSAVPVAFSLNRGLWICLVAGIVLTLAVGAFRGHKAAFMGSGAVLLAGAILVLATPLGQLVSARLDNPHSNDRRGNLAVASVRSVAEGSPVVGFGSTRDVRGNFFSIAGGSTPNCPACGAPPLGTQGQLWLVVFSQGLVGLAIFVSFFAVILSRTWRCRTELELTATVVLAFFAIQVFVYDTLGLPLFLVMTTIGAVCREQRESGVDPAVRTLAHSVDRLRVAWLPLVALMVLGALAGLTFSTARAVRYAAEVDVLLPHAPIYLPTAGLARGNPQNDGTVDTAAAAMTADSTLRSLARRVKGVPDPDVMRRRVLISAAPNTRLLEVTVFGTSAEQASSAASTLVDAFLAAQRAELEQRRARALADAPPDGFLYRAALDSDTSPGTVLRRRQPSEYPPDVKKYGASGMAIGLIAGVTLVGFRPDLLRQRRPRRPRRPRWPADG
jgi:hypothetical protein